VRGFDALLVLGPSPNLSPEYGREGQEIECNPTHSKAATASAAQSHCVTQKLARSMEL
jgi:hypothetical protein